MGSQKPVVIKAPKLPKSLRLAEAPDDLPADSETYSRLEYQRFDLSEQTLTRLHFEEALFTETNVSATRWDYLRVEDARFEDCPLNGTDFRLTDLTGVSFIRCDLSNADFTGATLTGANLRGCPIDGMRAGPAELRGAIIDEVQALALIRAMGITVE